MGEIGRKKKGANKAIYDFKKIRDDSLESSIILDSDEDNNISSDISFTSSEIDTDIDAIDSSIECESDFLPSICHFYFQFHYEIFQIIF
jgi:hypothetical protein